MTSKSCSLGIALHACSSFNRAAAIAINMQQPSTPTSSGMAPAFLFFSLLPQISPHLRFPFNLKSSEADLMLIHFATCVQVNEGSWRTAKYAGTDTFSRICSIPFLQGNSWGIGNFLLHLIYSLSSIFKIKKVVSLAEMHLDTVSVACRQEKQEPVALIIQGQSMLNTCCPQMGQVTNASHGVSMSHSTVDHVFSCCIPGTKQGQLHYCCPPARAEESCIIGSVLKQKAARRLAVCFGNLLFT